MDFAVGLGSPISLVAISDRAFPSLLAVVVLGSCYGVVFVVVPCVLQHLLFFSSSILFPLVVFPFSFTDGAVRVDDLAIPISLPIRPVPFEYSAIVPEVFAETALFIVFVVADVFSAVLPSISAIAMHHVVVPIALVYPPVVMPVHP